MNVLISSLSSGQHWENAKADNLPYTDEPTVEYRTSDADNSQSIIEFDHE